MIKRILFILLCIAGLGYAIYKITGNTIGDAADGANLDAVDRYAHLLQTSTINTTNMLNGTSNYNTSGIASSVKCEQVSVPNIGVVELHGCTVQGSNVKYQYVNGKASRE